ncbi:MAG: hypothetical protein U1E76_21975 [Planctomycetota bacterium]
MGAYGLLLVLCWFTSSFLPPSQRDAAAFLHAHGDELVAWSETSHFGLAKSVPSKLARLRNADSDGLLETLIVLSEVDRHFDAAAGPGSWIASPLVLEGLVHALCDPSATVTNYAMEQLWERGRPTALQPFAKELCEAWPRLQDERILCMLGALQGERAMSYLAQVGDLPRAVRARRDPKQAQALLDEFAHEQEGSKKAKLAAELGYVGSSDAVRALVSALRSPVVLVAGLETTSLRYHVLRALRRAFPDEPLFGDELERVVMRTKNVASPIRAEAQSDHYFERVETWCQERFPGRLWSEPRPEFLLVNVKVVH